MQLPMKPAAVGEPQIKLRQGLSDDCEIVAQQMGAYRAILSIHGGDWQIIYTTHAIESMNMSLREVIKRRDSFTSDEAFLKLFKMTLNNISKKWTMPQG